MSMSRKLSPASVCDLCNNASTSACNCTDNLLAAFPTHGFVFTGISLDFGAINTDVPQLKYPREVQAYSNICTNNGCNCPKKRLRNVLMLSWSGWVPPVI